MRDNSKRKRKRLFRKALESADFDAIIKDPDDSGSKAGVFGIFGSLVSLMYDADILIRWRAVDALVRHAQQVSKRDMESVREMLRRLAWAMNDESGGFIWMAPETTAGILHAIPKLADEFGSMLLSHYDLPCFENGIRYAAYVLSKNNPEIVRVWKNELASGLESDRTSDRAYTICALKKSDPEFHQREISRLDALDSIKNHSSFEHYDFDSSEVKTYKLIDFIADYS